MKAPLTVDRLRQVLHCDPSTGIFVWILSSGTARKGTVAGNIRPDGYSEIQIDGRKYLLHRLVWLYVNGSWPPAEVNHRDTNKGHNWIDNLRPSTRSQNVANVGRRSNNTSGFKGVSYYRRLKKYQAAIRVNGRSEYLGLFSDPAEAHAAYCAAAERLLGEFARAS